ncbi:hypothetical protein [Faecalibaculum rodentium]|uniref:hypothetical protein n=1 Tax=Faecalibaculum rodentium TaxID=1702221 RepID=UPI00130DB9DA|nr:hypothetical protein [Faecalibaculum rodentium]
MSDIYRSGNDPVLSFFRLQYRQDADLPGTVFHTDQMAELVSVFLIVLAAQIHHPIPVSNEHLFPFLMTGKVVLFQMILSFEKLLCAKTETNMPVLNIFLPPFQLCLDLRIIYGQSI